jgi:hypothetical protein
MDQREVDEAMAIPGSVGRIVREEDVEHSDHGWLNVVNRNGKKERSLRSEEFTDGIRSICSA